MTDPILVKAIQMFLFLSVMNIVLVVIGKGLEIQAKKFSSSKALGIFIYMMVFILWYGYVITYWFNLLQEATE